LNEERLARHQAEAVMLPASLDDPAAFEFRRVWLDGRFRNEAEMFLAARTHNRRVGYQIITPFERTDGTVVLVNRGWVPLESKEPETRLGGQVSGPVRVEGLVVLGQSPGWLTPDNTPDENFWFWVDLESLAAKAGIPTPTFLVDAGATPNPGGLPIGGQTNIELRSQHVQYIVIWYSFAISLTVIYLLFTRRGRRPKETSA
jgi:surfeit locus 1 family protein